MFGLFSRKPKLPEVKFKVYKTEVAKYKSLTEYVRDNGGREMLLGCFFDDTQEELLKLMMASKSSVNFTNFSSDEYINYENRYTELIIAELHPLKSRFYNVVNHFEKCQSIVCYTSLDNPFFERMGGGRLTNLMEKLGMDEYEEISHPMVTKSIIKAQEKIESKIEVEQRAKTFEEWVKINLPEEY